MCQNVINVHVYQMNQNQTFKEHNIEQQCNKNSLEKLEKKQYQQVLSQLTAFTKMKSTIHQQSFPSCKAQISRLLRK